MRIGILQFPGSNCERETELAVKRAGMEACLLLWNCKREVLRQCDGFIIVGGFSYEDRARAGIIAALDPVLLELKQQSELGKPILGICNGAQILVESGLVPGLEGNKIGCALSENKRMVNNKVLGTGYYNAWVYMRLSEQFQRNAFTNSLSPKEVFKLPIAHAEGRFLLPPALLEEVTVQGLNVFQYCSESGELNLNFPVNPNGSIANIAALSNKSGNVMAMMPHPERTPACDAIFTNMRNYISEGRMQNVPPLHYYPRQVDYKPYRKREGSREIIMQLMITDNQALSVEQALKRCGFAVKVKRYVHYEMICHDDDFEAIKKSGVVMNERKEMEVTPEKNSYLVRAKEDLTGKQKQQQLIRHFGVHSLTHLTYGVLWNFEFEHERSVQQHELLKTHIIYNPYAHDCYEYS